MKDYIKSRKQKLKYVLMAILFFAGGIICILTFLYPAKNTVRSKNLIIISIDTLRADSMGVYGYGKNITPNIDAFAENATIYTNAYTQVPVTYGSFAEHK